MPYTAAQCRKFAVMAASKAGPRPPADWKKHCKKGAPKKKARKK